MLKKEKCNEAKEKSKKVYVIMELKLEVDRYVM